MIAKCIGNSIRELSDENSRSAFARNIHLSEVGLTVGRAYMVYGIAFPDGDGVPWYLVCESEEDLFPRLMLGDFFELLDSSVPGGWEVAQDNNLGRFSIIPSRWARDSSFLEKLVDGEPEAVAYFRELREAMGDV